MGWIESLRGSIVGLDTTPLIYYTEANPTYIEVVDPFFKAVERGEFIVVTSIVTLLEVLVRPFRDGDLELAQQYRDFLFDSDNVSMHFLSQKIAEEAAHLRAFHNIRTPDAIQIATAIDADASFFLTNDIRLPSLSKLKVLTLEALKANELNQPSTDDKGHLIE